MSTIELPFPFTNWNFMSFNWLVSVLSKKYRKESACVCCSWNTVGWYLFLRANLRITGGWWCCCCVVGCVCGCACFCICRDGHTQCLFENLIMLRAMPVIGCVSELILCGCACVSLTCCFSKRIVSVFSPRPGVYRVQTLTSLASPYVYKHCTHHANGLALYCLAGDWLSLICSSSVGAVCLDV